MLLTFENLLTELGGLGRFQIYLCIFGFLVVLPVSITLYVPMFTLTVPNHRCALPDYPNDTYEVQSPYHLSLINLTIPVDEDGKMDPCTFYNRTDMDYNATKIQCNRWVYDKTYFDRSLIEQASVVCERKKFRTYANMLMILAEVFAAPLQGIVADIFGRRISLIGCVIGLIVGSIGSAFIVGIRSLLVLRFLSGAGTIQSFVAVYVLGVEYLVPRYRQHYAVMLNILWATGGLILTGIAYFVRDFMHLILGVSTPTVLFLIALYFTPESARWLIVKGKFQRARKTLQRVARVNSRPFPEELFNDVVAASQQKRAAMDESTTVVKLEEKDIKKRLNPEDNIVREKDETIWTFLSHRVLFIRFFILLANWVIVALVYYALVFNVSNMAGSVYMNFSLLNTADLAGLVTVYMTADKIGRRSTYAGFLLLASCACLSSLLPLFLATPDIAHIAIVALCMLGRVGVAACYSIIYLYTSELVPTGQRNTFIGIFSTFSRMGGVAGPYVADLGYLLGGNMKSVLPLLVCGTLGLIAFFLTLFLPETMGKALPSCVHEALHMGKKEKSSEKQVELDLLVKPVANGQACDGIDGYRVEMKNP